MPDTQVVTKTTTSIDLINVEMGNITKNDSIATNIKNSVNDFISNTELFSKETDTNKLDAYSKLIETSTGNLIYMLKPCADNTSSDIDKCNLQICEYNNDGEILIKEPKDIQIYRINKIYVDNNDEYTKIINFIASLK
jgi:hypothetical protein